MRRRIQRRLQNIRKTEGEKTGILLD